MSVVRTVLVCEAQVPFVYGGAERHVRGLVSELRRHGYRAKKVSIPFKPYPKSELLAQAALWRLVDLSEANYEPVDPSSPRNSHLLSAIRSKVTGCFISTARRRLVRDGIQRVLATGGRRPPSRWLIGLTPKPFRVEAAVQQCAEHGRSFGEIQRTHRRAVVPPATVGGGARGGPLRRLRPVGRPSRVE
jgi:hypothetical protein